MIFYLLVTKYNVSGFGNLEVRSDQLAAIQEILVMYHPGNRGNETLFKVLEASVGDSVKLTIETVSFPMKKCDLL